MYILMVCYAPLVAASAAVFIGDFRPHTLGSPLFQLLFLAIITAGFLLFAFGIFMFGQALSGKMIEHRLRRAALALLAAAMGAAPAFLFIEAINKLFIFMKS